MESKIILFISENFGRDIQDIHLGSMIEKDLGIYGDDAVELILGFGKKFDVDVSKFKAAKYFSAEGDFILPPFLKFLMVNKKTKDELTIKNLVDAVKYKKLDEEIIKISNGN